MPSPLAELTMRVADLEARMSGLIRFGKVTSVDPGAGTFTMELGPGHQSPPRPYAQIGGALSIHAPPSVGQEMMLVSPDGDMRNGVGLPNTFGGANASPGATADTNVLTFGGVTISLAGDGVVIAIGGATITASAAGIVVAGGDVVAEGISLRTHTHTDTPGTGAGTTSPPN